MAYFKNLTELILSDNENKIQILKILFHIPPSHPPSQVNFEKLHLAMDVLLNFLESIG